MDLLYAMEPKKIDDFVPLLTLDESDLNNMVRRMLKEKDDIEQGNRIYYLSEILKVIIKRCKMQYFYYELKLRFLVTGRTKSDFTIPCKLWLRIIFLHFPKLQKEAKRCIGLRCKSNGRLEKPVCTSL